MNILSLALIVLLIMGIAADTTKASSDETAKTQPPPTPTPPAPQPKKVVTGATAAPTTKPVSGTPAPSPSDMVPESPHLVNEDGKRLSEEDIKELKMRDPDVAIPEYADHNVEHDENDEGVPTHDTHGEPERPDDDDVEYIEKNIFDVNDKEAHGNTPPLHNHASPSLESAEQEDAIRHSPYIVIALLFSQVGCPHCEDAYTTWRSIMAEYNTTVDFFLVDVTNPIAAQYVHNTLDTREHQLPVIRLYTEYDNFVDFDVQYAEEGIRQRLADQEFDMAEKRFIRTLSPDALSMLHDEDDDFRAKDFLDLEKPYDESVDQLTDPGVPDEI